jgi:polar amino acid transport system substrate-binding protein
MPKLTGLREFLCVATATVCALGGPESRAASLQLVTERNPPFEDLSNTEAPGFSVEVLRHVFAAMGQGVSFEGFPWARSWLLVSRGERDGLFSALPSEERARICYFPDEPLVHEKWVFFVRSADVGTLKFSSFDDLVGHDIAVHGPAPGAESQPTVSPELWDFLRQHHNYIETIGTVASFRMLAAGRVDYAASNLSTGMRVIASRGPLNGKIEPLLSRSIVEGDYYVCFSKARVAPGFVDAFSRALNQFKQTEAFAAIYRKYFP